MGGASTWVARTTSSDGVRLGRQQRLGPSGRAVRVSRRSASRRLAPAPSSGRGRRGRGRRRRGSREAVGGATDARPVPATPAPVARTTPASVAPVTRISPATNRNTARMSAPSVESRCEVTQNSAWPEHPAARFERGRAPELRRGRRPGPDAERAGGQHQRDRGDQADQPRCAAGAPGGRSSRIRMRHSGQPPARPARRSRARRTRTGRRVTAPLPSVPPAQCR